MSKLVKICALAAVAAVLCGFEDVSFIWELNAYRGEPVRDAKVRLGRPVRTGYTDGQRIYWWGSTAPPVRGFTCKTWAAARHHVVVNWGYMDCAY